ncbi:hypothetical protein [Mitsuokella sp. WILCCON 0060]|uniref:SLAC1 family transporter n=1 Tax=unclassified Mitsuokella TaxID=2637239 RepID=UPI003F0C2285
MAKQMKSLREPQNNGLKGLDDEEQEPRPYAAVSSISMTLGLFALGIAWRRAGLILGLPREIGEGILAFTFVLWLFLLAHYAGQILRSPHGAGREFSLQLENPFFTLVPITTGLASVALSPYLPDFSKIMLVIGVVGQLGFSSYHIGSQWRGNTPLAMETPAMYMPTVGANFASAIALGAFGENEWGYLFFGAGFLSWMSLEAAFLFRLRTAEPMQPKERPLMGIQLAPAFVGSSAYLSCNGGQIDAVVLGLIGYGLLNLFFLLRLITWILRIGLSMSLWAFSFAMASMVNVGFQLWHAEITGSFQMLGMAFVVCGTSVIGLLLFGTARLVAARK